MYIFREKMYLTQVRNLTSIGFGNHFSSTQLKPSRRNKVNIDFHKYKGTTNILGNIFQLLIIGTSFCEFFPFSKMFSCHMFFHIAQLCRTIFTKVAFEWFFSSVCSSVL